MPANSSPVVAINHTIMNTIPKLDQMIIPEREKIKSQIKISFFLLYLSANLPMKNPKITTEKSKIPNHIPISVHHLALAIINGTINRIIE
jgi:hypothetical protein